LRDRKRIAMHLGDAAQRGGGGPLKKKVREMHMYAVVRRDEQVNKKRADRKKVPENTA